jgi:hypothetical protein
LEALRTGFLMAFFTVDFVAGLADDVRVSDFLLLRLAERDAGTGNFLALKGEWPLIKSAAKITVSL